ncbi:hypothetical protein Tco_0551155 [Tanacetum coccineum]
MARELRGLSMDADDYNARQMLGHYVLWVVAQRFIDKDIEVAERTTDTDGRVSEASMEPSKGHEHSLNT